jgi:hypothetical protein
VGFAVNRCLRPWARLSPELVLSDHCLSDSDKAYCDLNEYLSPQKGNFFAMLRLFVLMLLLANVGFYAWRQGWLDGAIDVRSYGDREPTRILQQQAPDLIKVLPPTAVPKP